MDPHRGPIGLDFSRIADGRSHLRMTGMIITNPENQEA
jgi:hypothetical protein